MVEVQRTQISEAQCVSSFQGPRNVAIQNFEQYCLNASTIDALDGEQKDRAL
jgi:hypothetical protein